MAHKLTHDLNCDFEDKILDVKIKHYYLVNVLINSILSSLKSLELNKSKSLFKSDMYNNSIYSNSDTKNDKDIIYANMHLGLDIYTFAKFATPLSNDNVYIDILEAKYKFLLTQDLYKKAQIKNDIIYDANIILGKKGINIITIFNYIASDNTKVELFETVDVDSPNNSLRNDKMIAIISKK
jgi:hypothetical protein